MFSSTRRMKWTAWALEYWALLGSIATFVAMVILLRVFNGKAVFAWNSVTLNTIVSILSLAMKASLAYVLAECMAQWKWILFAREARPLMDFERIDAATRGPLGSLRILIRTKGAPCLQFGAVLTLLAVGLDPLAQQLVQFRQSIVFENSNYGDSGNVALISRAPWYAMGKTSVTQDVVDNSTAYNYTVDTEIPLSMQSAILTGLSRSPWEVAQEPLVQCPTGNCTWDQFQTLGVCHKCNNITSDLKRTKGFGDVLLALSNYILMGSDIPSTAFSLPNGHFAANIDGCPPYNGNFAKCDDSQPLVIYTDRQRALTSFGTGNPNKTNSMKDIDTLIWSTSVIYPDVEWLGKFSSPLGDDSGDVAKWPDIPMRAMECAVYYCVKTIDSAVTGDRLVENITEATEYVRTSDSWERGSERENNLKENTPPDDERDSLEFDSRYSVVEYSDLVFGIPNNYTESLYRVDHKSVKSISAYFQNLLRANHTGSPRQKREIEKKLGKGAAGFNGVAIGPDMDDFSLEATPLALNGVWAWNRTNMSSTFLALSTSMTNEMRRNYQPGLVSYSGQDKDRFQDGTMTQFGSVGFVTAVYDIQWPWIALHGVMLAAVILFLFMTLVSSGLTTTVPLWKSSSLATIRRGYEVGDVFGGADTVEDMETTARKAYVKVPQRDFAETIPFSSSQNLTREVDG
ncbi:hypothetical protein AK830_g6852 [Neonectria ditissima]|uniref:Uncharacterized protein n=1 Tax=Neonectria ditissima TaxID=78410 RepID=A0A0P7APD9_9HYPO|nr:hypothetical protein AK830_g6852 [Neonectria ditissima]